jgi:hypothetical protein
MITEPLATEPTVPAPLPTPEQVIAAIKEYSEVSLINAPTQKYNAKAREKNKKVLLDALEKYPDMGPKMRNARHVRPYLIKLKPLLCASDEARRIINKEAEVRVECTRLRPKQWLAKIARLPEQERAQIACIIWWDFFADELSRDRVTDLDTYLRCNPAQFIVSRVRIEAALIFCGYTPHQAYRRAAGSENNRSDAKSDGQTQQQETNE